MSDKVSLRLCSGDMEFLKTLAEYRALTVPQITFLHFSRRRVARRRLGRLTEGGLVQTSERGLGRSRGRPESVYSLSRAGIDLLQEDSILPDYIEHEQVTAEKIHCLDHQLLVNWFRIHSAQIEKILPHLKVQSLSSTSPFSTDGGSLPVTRMQFSDSTCTGEPITFTPDGVLTITDNEQQKSVLFFVEVDMGTESLAKPARDKGDIRQKVINYQACFQAEAYKRYGEIFNCSLRGFRLLFLCNTPTRMAAVCRLVQEISPSDFVWVTDQEQMFSRGLGDAIWARGGRAEAGLESILNHRLCRPTPVLPVPD